MRLRGRPKGSGYDDATVIDRVFELMRSEGLSRRSAIIRICGLDQLRRIEFKMTALSRDLSITWRRTMETTDRKERTDEIADSTSRTIEGETCEGVGRYDLDDFLRLVAAYRNLGFGLIFVAADQAPA